MTTLNTEPDSRNSYADATVLLVEDEAPIRLLMWYILEGAGYRVALATDGFEGVRKLGEMGKVDLLITDLAMPGMSGITMAERAREMVPGIRVIYATGSRDCFPKFAPDVITIEKPFTVDELLRCVAEALRTEPCCERP